MKRLLPLVVILPALAISACKKSAPAAPSPIVTATPTPTVAPTATPTTKNEPPVFELALDPRPIRGTAPLQVKANLCRSFDPEKGPLTYEFHWWSGAHKVRNFCREDYTYTTPGEFRAWFCVKDAQNEAVCESFIVNIN